MTITMPSVKMLLISFYASSAAIMTFGEQDLCNTRHLDRFGDEMDSINSLLYKLLGEAVHSTSFSAYSDLNGYYGCMACDESLGAVNCRDCLLNAGGYLLGDCGFVDGGQIHTAFCQVRYEHYPFPHNCENQD